MVVVKIEMWPGGFEGGAYLLGEIHISNCGTGKKEIGNYKVKIKHGGKYFGKPGNYKTGYVNNFRRTLSPYHLLARALKNSGIR